MKTARRKTGLRGMEAQQTLTGRDMCCHVRGIWLSSSCLNPLHLCDESTLTLCNCVWARTWLSIHGLLLQSPEQHHKPFPRRYGLSKTKEYFPLPCCLQLTPVTQLYCSRKKYQGWYDLCVFFVFRAVTLSLEHLMDTPQSIFVYF